MEQFGIKGFGYYVPEQIVTNDDLSKLVDTSDEWIRLRTGIERRHISKTLNTSSLCARACEDLLKKTNTHAEEIDVIIVATMTPDYFSPSTACIVQKLLGAKNAFAFDINAACSGFIYALMVGNNLLKGSSYKNVVVVGGEVMSKAIDWKDRSTCVLFGDGAGAVLLSETSEQKFLGFDIHSDGSRYESLRCRYLPFDSPYSKKDDQKLNFLEMDGRAIFEFATKLIPKSLSKLVEDYGTTFDDIKYIVPHQANYRIIEYIAKKLKIDISKFYLNINEYGNTSAASIPIALAEMHEKGLITIGSNEKIILTGFGGGLTWGSILLVL